VIEPSDRFAELAAVRSTVLTTASLTVVERLCCSCLEQAVINRDRPVSAMSETTGEMRVFLIYPFRRTKPVEVCLA